MSHRTEATEGANGSLARNFDSISSVYDATFTNNVSVRLQRGRIWGRMIESFSPKSRILEMACGTGEDALYLASRGYRVEAFDASQGMIQEAQKRATFNPRLNQSPGQVRFSILSFEEMESLDGLAFDGGFTNFGGLNCVGDLDQAFSGFAKALSPGAPLLICMIGRFCLWEILGPLLRGRWAECLHRVRGYERAGDGIVRYPTLTTIRKTFHPYFLERSVEGLGVALPSYYRVNLFEHHPHILQGLAACDLIVGRWPVLCACGDNTLFVLERRV